MYHAVSDHEYLLFQSPKAMSILITKKTLLLLLLSRFSRV